MRLRALWPDMPPPLLTSFTAADWPAATERQSFKQWLDARKVFFDQHGWPSGFLGRLREETAESHRRLGTDPFHPGNPGPGGDAA